MNKERIIVLLRTLSIAVINNLSKRDLGIGKESATLTAFEETVALRGNIVKTNIDLKLDPYVTVELNSKSFLNTLSSYDIECKKFNNFDIQIADVVAKQMNIVKNELYPEVNELAEKFSELAGTLANANYQNTYNVVFLGKPDIYVSMETTGELVNAPKSIPVLKGLVFKFPRVNTFNEIKSILTNENALVDNEITQFLNTESESYWVDLYNNIFANLVEDNSLLLDFNGRRFLNFKNTIFCYLVARVFNVKIPFKVNGLEKDVKWSVGKVYDYLLNSIVNTGNLLDILTKDKTLILYNSDRNIVVAKELFKTLNNVDLDVIIAASLNGTTNVDDISNSSDKLKTQYKATSDLFMIDINKKRVETLQSFAMKCLDGFLEANPELSSSRGNIARYIYKLDEHKLAKIKNVFSDILIITKYNNTNCDYIVDRMKEYRMQGEEDVNVIAEYAALDLISKYLIDTHCVLR